MKKPNLTDVSQGQIDFDGINQAALREARSLLQNLLPGGKFNGSQYIVKNPNRDDRKPGSFTINHKTGVWKDFSSGEGGGDLVSLHAYRWHCGQSVAALRLADKFGVPVTKSGSAKAQKASAGAASQSAPKIHLWGNEGPPIGKDEIRRHPYRDASKTAVKIKIKNHNSKYLTWYRVFKDGNPIGWQAKKPDDFVTVPYVTGALDPFDPELKDDHILWPEGEKDVDTLSEFNLLGFTFGGTGDGLPEGIELLLKDRHLVVLADNDDAGRAHAEKKAKVAHRAGAASIRVVHFPELPQKGDVSNFIANGGTVEQLNARIDAAPLWLLAEPTPKNASQQVHAYKTEGRWPIMDEAAYHGLAGDVVRTIAPHTESDPNAILVQFLVYFGNSAGNSAATVRLSDGLLQRLPPNQKPMMLVEAYGREAPVQHEGECNDESSCSRSSRLDAFSGCRICSGGLPHTLWLQLHSYGSALRLCRSSLVGTGPHAAWVRAIDLRTTTLRTGSCLPSATGGARLFHSAVSRSSATVLRLRTRLLGALKTRC
jgi:hypothetical protein